MIAKLLYIPLFTYIISSIILIYKYYQVVPFKKPELIEVESISRGWGGDFIPQISQTGQKKLDHDNISYTIYLFSFLIIGLSSSLFYINYVYYKETPVLSRIIQCMGLCACFLNIVQGIYPLDYIVGENEYSTIHEYTAYGGIFLHLLALTLWVYSNLKKREINKEKNENIALDYIWYCVALSFISIIAMFMLIGRFPNLGAIAQRLCVFFLLLSVAIFAYYN